jgi:hypothetical protein
MTLSVATAVLWRSAAEAGDLRPDQIYQQSIGAVCTVSTLRDERPVSLGSGFVISTDGLVATNKHVIAESSSILVRCGDETVHRASVVAVDRENDLAVVDAGFRTTHVLRVSRASPAGLIGRDVFVIGNPEGLEGTISNGLLSGIRRDDRIELIQISAPISHGSSGGPVLLSDGTVIGVATAMLEHGQNLNFATPAKLLFGMPAVMDRLGPRGGWLGFRWGAETASVIDVLFDPRGPFLPSEPWACSDHPDRDLYFCRLLDGKHKFSIEGVRPQFNFSFVSGRLNAIVLDFWVRDRKVQTCSRMKVRVEAWLTRMHGAPQEALERAGSLRTRKIRWSTESADVELGDMCGAESGGVPYFDVEARAPEDSRSGE